MQRRTQEGRKSAYLSHRCNGDCQGDTPQHPPDQQRREARTGELHSTEVRHPQTETYQRHKLLTSLGPLRRAGPQEPRVGRRGPYINKAVRNTTQGKKHHVNLPGVEWRGLGLCCWSCTPTSRCPKSAGAEAPPAPAQGSGHRNAHTCPTQAPYLRPPGDARQGSQGETLAGE